jgi:hypothetical protein
MTENGWDKERKKNGEPATPILVADGKRGLKQYLWKVDGSLNNTLLTKPLHEL